MLPFAADQLIFTEGFTLYDLSVIPPALDHIVGNAGDDHSRPAVFSSDFITDQQDHFCLRYQEETVSP
jgi:hypothetical protein